MLYILAGDFREYFYARSGLARRSPCLDLTPLLPLYLILIIKGINDIFYILTGQNDIFFSFENFRENFRLA